MIEVHPIALKIPPMRLDEYTTFRDDIAKNGLLSPITLFEGKILDGVHRARGCRELGIEPRYETYEGSDPFGFVLSKNLHRRSLTLEARKALASEYLKEHPDFSDREIAKKTGVSHHTAAKIRVEEDQANGQKPISDEVEDAAGETLTEPPDVAGAIFAAETGTSLPRVERGLKKDGTPRKARGRKPGTTAAPKAPAEPESHSEVTAIPEAESDQWVASTRKFLSTNTEDTMFALTTFIREYSDQIKTKINEQKRTFFVKQFATSMGLKIADA